ncbi:haloacid dehalogenase-like hydrolase [Solirubrobacter phytolaccae]|uniref:Haloacid dehalogenase-like hydrolase n=1 Tax=Solirubrobacter phytolaccae TaxID=1404360 RepID=A0A9X3S937_9ACTN|nr:HAD family hydrolase [Solirubrobacter phytolaccae]MDA0178850.1 haloacid dehalogenase-like hydrolase [Solirubrobacter phytolaccae]
MSLASWNDGAARSAILAYLDGIADVDAADRVAVVDNDGTLWCEKPAYIQAFFLLARLHEQAAADPELASSPVVQALLANDLAGAASHGMGEVVRVLMNTHADLTTEEFDVAVAHWLADFRHPRFGSGFTGLVYAPMLELLDLLREHGFRVFIVTGGGVDFVRPVARQLYGVQPDDVVGSAVEVEFTRRDGQVVLSRTAKLAGSPNEGPPKVVNIHARIGRRPLVAIGNSAGDREMLEYAHTGPLPSLCLVVDHDDEAREYKYGGEALTNPDAEPIATTAERFGWTTISMRDDWTRVFA